MEFIGKKYKMTSSENFDEFMKAIGEWLSNVVLFQSFYEKLLMKMPAGAAQRSVTTRCGSARGGVPFRPAPFFI